MIQSTPVKAITGRDDAVIWPIVSDGRLTSPSGITRMVVVFTKDGYDDVIVDSDDVPSAYDFAWVANVRGRVAACIRWLPGLAIQTLFPVSGRWVGRVYLWDALTVHEGVEHGTFAMEVSRVILNTPAGPQAGAMSMSGGAGSITHFGDVILLLPMTAMPFVDLSLYVQSTSIPSQGDLVSVSASQYPFSGGGYSGDFSAPGSSPFHISVIEVAANASLNLNGKDFTAELWFYVKPGSRSGSWSLASQIFGYAAGGGITSATLNRASAGATDTLTVSAGGRSHTTGATITASVWRHLAITRVGTSIMFFLDGVQLGSTQTLSSEPNSNGPISIGGSSPSYNQPFIGYLSNLRITRNFARYTANFTPPTAPFALD